MRISDWSSDVCSSDLIETAAIAIAMNRLRHCRPPVRWPAGPEDRLSGRDGTVPITWDAAEQYREDAAVALGAIPENAIHKALADRLQEEIEDRKSGV